MADRKISLIGGIGVIAWFLIQWAATDVLDNQTIFLPHEKVNDVVEIVAGNKDESEESLTTIGDDSDQGYLSICHITATAANVRSDAGKSNTIVATAHKGETYTATGDSKTVSGTTWYEIVLENEEKAWISQKVCEIETIKNEETKVAEQNDNQVGSSDDEQITVEKDDSASINSEAISFFTKKQMTDIFGKHIEQSNKESATITDGIIEDEMQNVIREAKYSASYSNPAYIGKKILHIVLALIILAIMLIIFLFIVFDHKFLGLLLFVGMIAFTVVFWRDNTEYSYKITNKYELISAEYGTNCDITFYEGDEVSSNSIDPTKVQVIVFPNDTGTKYYYHIKKKTKNIWYYITESKPREREIHLIY